MAPGRAKSDFGLQRWIETLELKQIFLIFSEHLGRLEIHLLKDERFGRFVKHRSIVDLQQTLKYVRFTKIQYTFERWTIYEDSIADLSKPLKDERRGHTNHRVKWRVKVRQNVSKRLKARQICVDDDDDDECNLEKTSLINCTGDLIMHRTPNTNYGLRSQTSNAKKRPESVRVFIRSFMVYISSSAHFPIECGWARAMRATCRAPP